jgi:hypothetical protein
MMKKFVLILLVGLSLFGATTKMFSQCFPNGNALNFVGGIVSGPNITFANLSDFNIPSTSAVTLEAWVFSSGFYGGINAIVGNSADGNGPNGGYSLWVSGNGASGGQLALQTKYAALWSTANVVPLNQWTHVAAVITSPTTAKLYVNGVEITSTIGSVNFETSTSPFYIGSIPYGVNGSPGAWRFNGKIDEVRIWNTDRSALIASTYNTIVPSNSTGLLGYFSMNQGTANGTNTSITSLTNSVPGGPNGIFSGGWALSGTSSNFTTSATPAAITSVTHGSICNSASVALSAAANGTINWYAAATGGSSLATGTSYTTPVISSTTTYYVDATSGSCTSPRTPVIAGVPGVITGNATVPIGSTTQLTMTPSVTGTWSSSNTSLATVNTSGLVTAVASGSPVITFTASGGCSVSYNLSVYGSPPISITSFTPTSQDVAGNVTITGTGFNATAANNIVYFGGVKGTVVSGTTTSLVVTVPVGALHAPITVINSGLAVQSGNEFSPKNSNIAASGFDNSSFATSAVNVSMVSNSLATDYTGQLFSMADLNGDGKLDLIK